MNQPGDSDPLVVARRVLLDAIAALSDQRDALILIGAQAIYLQTGDAPVALPAATKDSDIAIDRRRLHPEPRLEEAMTGAGFLPGTDPGAWLSPDGVPVDLMIPESMSDPGGRRGGRMPPHSRRALRRASGLEAAIVDHAPIAITALNPTDHRSRAINVAGPAALLVAKLHKLGERNDRDPERLNDKDAHDVYRLLVSYRLTPLITRPPTLVAHSAAGRSELRGYTGPTVLIDRSTGRRTRAFAVDECRVFRSRPYAVLLGMYADQDARLAGRRGRLFVQACRVDLQNGASQTISCSERPIALTGDFAPALGSAVERWYRKHPTPGCEP